MKSLQKELSKKAKNKTDTSVDVPRIVGHTKFLLNLEEVLLLYRFHENQIYSIN
jgi:hypothetical protein